MMKVIGFISAFLMLVYQSPAQAEKLQFLPSESESDSEVFVKKAWDSFKIKYDKAYSGIDEETRRKQIFYDSLKTIESHNHLYETGRSTFNMGINQFSDMEFSEILEMNGYSKSNSGHHYDAKYDEPFSSVTDDVIPSFVNWTSQGYVTPVKNQKQCGSCWAFSATGSLEGQTRKKTGHLVSLSEQELVDCSMTPHGNYGCYGGETSIAFEYIIRNGGIDTEISYPYIGQVGNCSYRPDDRGATMKNYSRLTNGSEEELTKAIATVGPISVAIDVRSSFQHYKSGIYEDPFCGKIKSNHAALAVGYGSQNGRDYYIVKNSWGTDWGSRGYILFARGADNMCGIATNAMYPVV